MPADHSLDQPLLLHRWQPRELVLRHVSAIYELKYRTTSTEQHAEPADRPDRNRTDRTQFSCGVDSGAMQYGTSPHVLFTYLTKFIAQLELNRIESDAAGGVSALVDFEI